MEYSAHIESLTKGAQSVIDGTVNERIRKCRESVWIPYPMADKILEELEILFDYPKKDRMPNLLIAGGTKNGKTSILNRFYKNHPDYTAPESNIIPIVHFSAPISPSENALYEKILDFIRAPYGVNDSASRKEYQVLNILKNIQTKIIVIDEFQDIYHGTLREQRKFLAAIKHLGNELKIPIVGAGIPEVQRTISADPQMANRFETFRLETWKLDEAFARLIMSFEKTLPLKEPSNLHKLNTRARLHYLSEGILGEVATIVERSAIYALEHGKEHIEIEMFDLIPYQRPSERRR